MESKEFSVKEKMLIAAILKEFLNRFKKFVQEMKLPFFAQMMNDDLIRVTNWVNLELASLELGKELIDAAMMSNYAWKELDGKKKMKFIENIKLFITDEALCFQGSKSGAKDWCTQIMVKILNELNA